MTDEQFKLWMWLYVKAYGEKYGTHTDWEKAARRLYGPKR